MRRWYVCPLQPRPPLMRSLTRTSQIRRDPEVLQRCVAGLVA